MFILKRYGSLFLLIAFMGGYSESSRAEDYYWTIGNSSSTTPYSTPRAAADAYLEAQRALYSGQVLTEISLSSATATRWTLRYTRGASTLSTSFYRWGDSCTSPNVYNSETGACENPYKCESTIGVIVHHEFSFKSLDTDGNPSTDPPITVCKDNCQYSHQFGDFSTKRDFGPPDMLVGSFTYKGNGVACTASATNPSVFDHPPAKDPVKNAPEYASSSTCDNWVTQEDGTLKRSCNAKTSFKNEGNVECTGGTAGSGFSASVTCTPSKTNPPEKTETNVDKETTKKENSDGSTDTNTTTDTTKTECKGTKPCTSTTKSETQSDTADSDGNTTSSSSNCTGSGCNPDKTDESTDDEEDDSETSTSNVSGESCSATLTCEGDVIQCAILRKQKEQACAWDYDEVKADIESEVAGEGYQLGEDSISLGDSFSDGSGASRWLSSGCPASRSVSVIGHSFTLSWEPVCDFSRSLSYVIVAMAGLFFAVYVGRGLGGQ